MKRLCAFAALIAALITAISAQVSLTPGTIATFDLKAHTTLGLDLDTGGAGLQTAVDAMQIWFEIFPTATRGVSPAESGDLTASIRVEGSRYALKWSSEPFRGENYFDRVIARLDWRNWWLEVARSEPAEEPTIFEGRASLDSLFDLGLLPGNRDLVDIGTSELPLSGQLKGGAVFDRWSFDLRVASKGTWETNTDQAWIFGAKFAAEPIRDLRLALGGIGSINYDKSRPGTNPFAGSASASYLLPLGGKLALRPYLGFDGKYDLVAAAGKWELGGGIAFHWNGADYEAWSEAINGLADTVPVGLSLSANYAGDGYASALFALFEEARKDSLVPNLGGFLAAEVLNIGVARYEDRAYALAGRLEYLIGKVMKPYAEARFVQGYVDGKLTGTDSLSAKAGLLLSPAKLFTLDLRYERTDGLGLEGAPDPGLLTSTFTIKL